MKTVICFGTEKMALEQLGYKPVQIKRYQSNRLIYKVDVDVDSIPAVLCDSLFEPVLVSATRIEISDLQQRGVHNLFKANRDSVALFLKPFVGTIPKILIPYTDFRAGSIRHQAADIAKEKKERVEQRELDALKRRLG